MNVGHPIDRDFPHQVEIVVPTRAATRNIVLGWCTGKAYRTIPPALSPGQPARFCFIVADDAEFFQVTFGGTVVDRRRQ